MPLNDKGINRIAFVLTLVLHIAFFAIQAPRFNKKIQPVIYSYKVPVQLKLAKSIVKKSVKKKKVVHINKSSKKKILKKITKSVHSQPVWIAGDRKKPEVFRSVAPVYPKTAQNLDLKGTIEVEVLVDSKGKPKTINILKSTGFEILDKAFIRAIQNYYVFKPKRKTGNNMEGKLKLSYTFGLEG